MSKKNFPQIPQIFESNKWTKTENVAKISKFRKYSMLKYQKNSPNNYIRDLHFFISIRAMLIIICHKVNIKKFVILGIKN